jgi:hypothetical protein
MNATLKLRFDDRTEIETTRQTNFGDSAPGPQSKTLRFERLRQKLIQETEWYLNNPDSQTWARAG